MDFEEEDSEPSSEVAQRIFAKFMLLDSDTMMLDTTETFEDFDPDPRQSQELNRNSQPARYS